MKRDTHMTIASLNTRLGLAGVAVAVRLLVGEAVTP